MAEAGGFYPKFKVVIDGNYEPIVPDEELFQRFVIVPWTRTFIDGVVKREGSKYQKPDRYLFEKLQEERQGILNWMLEGMQQWLKDGELKIPEVLLKK